MTHNTLVATLNRLAKWRMFFASWQLGTRASDDAEAQAVRDHREATLLLRVEVSALGILLIKKGVFTEEEFSEQLETEAKELMKMLEHAHPGFRSVDSGMAIDLEAAKETTKNWRP